jgi:hypothetical protein
MVKTVMMKIAKVLIAVTRVAFIMKATYQNIN